MEILAPAGNFSSLKAAIYSGANAVYLGLGNFNARAKADNFNEDNLYKAVHFAHLFGVKVYCAFNTLIKNDEFDEVLKAIQFADECHVDAIIMQDLGLINEVIHNMPHIVIHASTQMGIHNVQGAKEVEKIGIKRVILSRETFLEDIIKIHKETNLEIEFFVQGALCVAFSGNCYFSSLVSGYSGNRGKCMQLCRKKYTLQNDTLNKSGYYLSTKDLCLIEELKTLERAGVMSIKIEGRLRSSEYVGECVKVYKKALESNVDKNDIDDLKSVFNRGEFCKAHLYNDKKSIIFPTIQNNIGLKVGSVKEVKNNIAYLNTTKKLSIGDGVKYLRQYQEVGYGLITNADNSTTFKGNLTKGDEVRLTSSKNLAEKINNREYKLPITISIVMRKNELTCLTMYYNDISAQIYGNNKVESAQKQPLTMDSLRSALNKFGETYFTIKDIDIKIDDDIFYPVSQINTLRRDTLALLENKICGSRQNINNISNTISHIEWNNCLCLTSKSSLFIQIDNYLNIKEEFVDIADYIVFSPHIYKLEDIKTFKSIFGNKAVLNLPLIARGDDVDLIKSIIDFSGIDIFIVNNLYAVNLCKSKTIIAGIGLNLLNNKLNITKINSIESESYECNKNSILYAYGYQVFMTLCHCPKYDLNINCCNCDNNNYLKLSDERNKFSLSRIKLVNCYWQVVNTIPLNLLEEVKKMSQSNVFLDFTNIVSEDEIKEVLKSYKNGESLQAQHTHGNFGKKLY